MDWHYGLTSSLSGLTVKRVNSESIKTPLEITWLWISLPRRARCGFSLSKIYLCLRGVNQKWITSNNPEPGKCFSNSEKVALNENIRLKSWKCSWFYQWRKKKLKLKIYSSSKNFEREDQRRGVKVFVELP